MKKILKSIADFFTGAAKKIKDALKFGVTVANQIKNVVDSPILDLAVKLTPTLADDAALLAIRNGLAIWIDKMGWAEKKVSDFDSTTLPHVLNSIAAEAAVLKAEYENVSLSRQQAIAAEQIVYDGKIVE